MATLGPLGYLLIWLAIAAAPPGATMVRVETTGSARVELTRDSKGRWMRTVPVEQPVLYTKEGTALRVRAAVPTGNPADDERRVPLHEWFVLTGKEDFSKPVSILVKPGSGAGAGRQVTADAGEDRMEITTTGTRGKAGRTLVTWNARR